MAKKIKRSVEDRIGVIGGSQIGALLGYSKFQSPHDVWLTYMGKDQDKVISPEQAEIFEMGHQLEEFIARQVERLYEVKTKRSNFAYVHPKDERIICHPDRLIVGKVNGKRIGLEIKSSSAFDGARWGESNTDDIPADYLCQCHDYIMCDVCDEVWLARFSNNRITRYIVKKDEVLEENLLSELVRILDSFENGVEPEITNFEEAKYYYSQPTEDSIEADEDALKAMTNLDELNAKQKALKEEIDLVKARIVSFMKDKKLLVDNLGNKLATYTKVTQTRFDTKTFQQDYPELFKKYSNESSYMKLS